MIYCFSTGMAYKIEKMQIISKWQTIKHGSKISITSQQASILFEQISSKCILILAHWRSNLTSIFAIAKQHFEVCTWKVKYRINSYFTLCLNSTWWLFMNGKHSRSLYFFVLRVRPMNGIVLRSLFSIHNNRI